MGSKFSEEMVAGAFLYFPRRGTVPSSVDTVSLTDHNELEQ